MADDVPPICGTALAAMDRIRQHRETVDALKISAARDGDRLIVELLNTSERAAFVDVSHAESPGGGGRIFGSKHCVSIPPGETVRIELPAGDRDGPFHLVFQDVDAFASRTVG